jgi:hypothetical protein
MEVRVLHCVLFAKFKRLYKMNIKEDVNSIEHLAEGDNNRNTCIFPTPCLSDVSAHVLQINI